MKKRCIDSAHLPPEAVSGGFFTLRFRPSRQSTESALPDLRKGCLFMTNVITPNRSANTPSKVQMITLVGVFAAISTILMCFELPLPLMPPFLKVDLSGVPILIMGFLYGPLPAIYVTIIKDQRQIKPQRWGKSRAEKLEIQKIRAHLPRQRSAAHRQQRIKAGRRMTSTR